MSTSCRIGFCTHFVCNILNMYFNSYEMCSVELVSGYLRPHKICYHSHRHSWRLFNTRLPIKRHCYTHIIIVMYSMIFTIFVMFFLLPKEMRVRYMGGGCISIDHTLILEPESLACLLNNSLMFVFLLFDITCY